MSDIKQVKLGVDQEQPYSVRNRKYLAEVRKIQKSHLSKEQWNGKDKFNKDWEKEWLPFIKYDNQWDWAYMLDLLIYKLELMRTSFKYFCHHVDQDKMISQIDEAIVLGKRIYNQESADEESYHKPWIDYHTKHSTPYAYVYETTGFLSDKIRLPKRGKLLAKIQMPKDDDMNLKRIWTKRYKSPLDKWLEANNKTEYKDVTVSYGSDWNNFPHIRKLVLKHLLNKCNKNYKKDKEKFFKIYTEIIKADNYSWNRIRARHSNYKLYLKNTKYINNWDLVDYSAPHIVAPNEAFSSLFKHLKNVDFPVPDGPIMEITSPLLTSREISLMTERLPNDFLRFFTWIIVSAILVYLHDRFIRFKWIQTNFSIF